MQVVKRSIPDKTKSMCSLRTVNTASAERVIQHAVPLLLCSPSGQHAPQSWCGSGHDGRDQAAHRPVAVYVWPGRREGVRAPTIGETPLSDLEVCFGLAAGMLHER